MEIVKTKKQKRLDRMYETWREIFGDEKVYFKSRKGYPATYSPRYKGKRDYSCKVYVTIIHNLEMPKSRKKLNAFCCRFKEWTNTYFNF